MTGIITWLLYTIAVERSAELIVDSKIFEPLRRMIKSWAYSVDKPPEDNLYQHFKVMVDYLFHCGYCVSVWVSAFFAYFNIQNVSEHWVINYMVTILALHGSSNLYHVLYELLRRGRIRTHDVNIKIIEEVEEEKE